MPIQPRSTTRRLNARLCESPCPGRSASKVPAAISCARKALTSPRSASHSGGRRIGSKRSSAVMAPNLFDELLHGSVTHSTRGDKGPEFVGAAGGHQVAERHGPMTFAAEVVAPGQHPQRETVQDVLLGEADGAMHLVRDR